MASKRGGFDHINEFLEQLDRDELDLGTEKCAG